MNNKNNLHPVVVGNRNRKPDLLVSQNLCLAITTDVKCREWFCQYVNGGDPGFKALP